MIETYKMQVNVHIKLQSQPCPNMVTVASIIGTYYVKCDENFVALFRRTDV